MGKILPIILGLIGLGAGLGAGLALKPAPQEIALSNPCGDVASAAGHGEDEANSDDTSGEHEASSGNDFVKMNNQFVVPVVAQGKVSALVVMSLSLEISVGGSEAFYQREPKLRDAFLQVLFDHANTGGFDGVFTQGGKLDILRNALREIAQKTMGNGVIDVLVTDILRQDI